MLPCILYLSGWPEFDVPVLIMPASATLKSVGCDITASDCAAAVDAAVGRYFYAKLVLAYNATLSSKRSTVAVVDGGHDFPWMQVGGMPITMAKT
jgi:hypothetical protein